MGSFADLTNSLLMPRDRLRGKCRGPAEVWLSRESCQNKFIVHRKPKTVLENKTKQNKVANVPNRSLSVAALGRESPDHPWFDTSQRN